MDTCLFDMLHDAGDLDLPAVGDSVDVGFERVLQIAVDQHRAGPGDTYRVPDVAIEPGGVMNDFHCAAAENIRRADYDRISDAPRDLFSLACRMRRAIVRLTQSKAGQQSLEPVSILG